MNVEKLDCVVIGAGVVGLAVARALTLAGREVVVVEKEASIGMETSSRNSEVIHAGIYYPTGSLKARACVEGKAKLYAYLRERELPHSNCGKLIVAASEDQRDRLLAIQAKAEANGVNDLRLVERDELSRMEPALKAVAALLSPSTGIVDSHAYMLALQGDAENGGAFFAFNTPVLRGEAREDGILIETGGEAPMAVLANLVVNAAGLAAPLIARKIAGMPDDPIPEPHYAKGNYFTLNGRSPFSRLIYPMPEQGGLGVHLTLDLGGQAKFGPDVEWLEGVGYEAIDYTVDPSRGEKFYAAIRSYWPDLKDGALTAGYSGVRPKIAARGAPDGDFTIQGPAVHGVKGLVHLFGIESPGLTSSLALADLVTKAAAD